MKNARYKVLFVCTGNICRSPTAEGVLRHRLAQEGLSDVVFTDSCGMHGYHQGEPPDPRSIATAAKRGYDLQPLRARKIVKKDFDDFDLLLAMDGGHFEELTEICPAHNLVKIRMFTDRDVPDPWYGPQKGFEHVLDLIESGVDALLADIRKELS